MKSQSTLTLARKRSAPSSGSSAVLIFASSSGFHLTPVIEIRFGELRFAVARTRGRFSSRPLASMIATDFGSQTVDRAGNQIRDRDDARLRKCATALQAQDDGRFGGCRASRKTDSFANVIWMRA